MANLWPCAHEQLAAINSMAVDKKSFSFCRKFVSFLWENIGFSEETARN